MNVLFQLANTAVMPYWLMMLARPRHPASKALVRLPLPSLLLALAYAALVLPQLGTLLPLLMKPELSQIQALLATPEGATLGWLHFLAFDLLVARWIVLDETPVSPWVLRLALFLTLMFGPLGWLTYLALRRPITLTNLSWGMLALVAVCLLGLALDPRTVTGLPVWAKPLKFALSVLFYSLTLDAVLVRLPDLRAARRLGQITAFWLTVEMVVITLQAARGTTSHFNQASPFDALAFSLMGIGIVIVWTTAMRAGLLAWRGGPDGLRLALAWGFALTVVGMGLGWIMIGQNAHTVGAPDGGPGLPLLGWSTLHGDLRIPHFLGLHCLQLMPLAWVWLRARVSARSLPGALHCVGFGLLIAMSALSEQALRGHSLFQPDGRLLLELIPAALFLWVGTRPEREAGRESA